MREDDQAARRPEPARELELRGAWGYTDPIGVAPATTLRFHVSAPAAYDLSIVRLGHRAILDPAANEMAERADVEVLERRAHPTATPQTLSAGSYVYVGGEPIPGGPLTLGLWLRLWRLPVIDAIQWAWFGLISDIDYPEACRFGLLVDHLGRLCAYAGDGGAFEHASMLVSDPCLDGHRLGRWVHVAATIASGEVVIYLDGGELARGDGLDGVPAPGPASRLRLGATAERGRADDFLDGDIAAPFVAARALTPDEIARLVADRARTPLAGLGLPLQGAWDLDEERGTSVRDASDHGRVGIIVQGATWQIGGPAFDASRGDATYDPASDPGRGHGLRLSSDDVEDCEWAVTDEWQVPEDAASGIYAGLVQLAGTPAHTSLPITFIVTRTTPRVAGSIALLAATNTWLGYGRRPRDQDPVAGLSASWYSVHASGRPFFKIALRAPIPRATPFGFESDRAAFLRHSHLVRPERYAEAWLAAEGYPYEMITDLDLHRDPELLERFGALMIVGHSEYWSDEARDGVEAYLARGGRVISLSGNTLFWRVTFDPEHPVIESRKAVASEDRRWLAPPMWGERWHEHDGRAGSHFPLLDRHGYKVLGLDTHGMIDDGTPTSFAAFHVLHPEHPLFNEPERVPVTPEGTIGERNLNGPQASGYEFDSAPESLGYRDTPLEGMTILASALGQRNIEWGGVDSDHWGGVERDHGGDIIIWERPDGGRVFNIGSIGASGALSVDPGVGALVRNVLAGFGVPRVARGR